MWSQVCQVQELRQCIHNILCMRETECSEAVLHAAVCEIGTRNMQCRQAALLDCAACESSGRGGSRSVAALFFSGVHGSSLQGAPGARGLHPSRELPEPWPPPPGRSPSLCTSGTQTPKGPPPASHCMPSTSPLPLLPGQGPLPVALRALDGRGDSAFRNCSTAQAPCIPLR